MAEFKAHFKSVQPDLGGSLPGQLIFGIPGKDGGYYTIQITQPDSDTMRLTFTASKEGMEQIAPADILLPKGPKGEPGEVDMDQILRFVDEYLSQNPPQIAEKDPTVPEWAKQPTKPKYTADEVGAVATVNGQTPDENGNVEIEIPEGGTGSGLTTAQINALDGMFKVCAFTKPDVSAEYNAFKTAFGIGGGEEPDIPDVPDEPDVPGKTLTSISATYSGGSVTAGTAVNDLTGIVVTAHYSDGTSEVVTGYTLSGTIAEGENTITVSYGGMTTTFTVTGVDSEPFVNLIDGMTFVNTGYSGSYVASGLAADKYVNETDITFEAGVTYYAYAPFTLSNAPSAKVFANDGSGAYTDSGVTATRQSYYKNGNYDAWGEEKEDTHYMVADGIYLIKNVFTPSETITGKLSYSNKCAYKSYPDYMYLFTKEYNPFKDSLE